MSNGTDKRMVSRRLRRATLVGLGVLAVMPALAQAQTSGSDGIAPGQPIQLGKETPASVTKALKANRPVVISFLLPNVTEDDIVRSRIEALQKSEKYRGTTFLTFRITSASKLGDLPDVLGVRSTPTVVVVQRNKRLSNTWRGLVDQEMIGQSIDDAEAAVPSPMTLPRHTGPTTGNKASITMLRKVNANYAKIPSVKVSGTGSIAGTPAGRLEMDWRLNKGRTAGATGKTTTGDGVPVDLILNRTGMYTRPIGATCWIRDTSARVRQALDVPLIPLAGTVVGPPTILGAPKGSTTGKAAKKGAKKGKGAKATAAASPKVRITVTDKGGNYGFGTATYVIDRSVNQVLSVSTKRYRLDVTTDAKAGTKADAVPKPDAVC